MRKLLTVLAALATLSLTNCGYNAIQTNDEQVKSAWSEVLNQFQRRAAPILWAPRAAASRGRSAGRPALRMA